MPFVNGKEMLCKNQQTCIKTDVAREAACKTRDVKLLRRPNDGGQCTFEVGHISITFSPLRSWPIFLLASIYFETFWRNSTCERCETKTISKALGGEISKADNPNKKVGGHQGYGIAGK